MKECTVHDCSSQYLALGFCRKHYKRFKKYGDTSTVMPFGGIRKPRKHTKRTVSNYTAMKHRCYNPSSNVYKYYGGRGIRVCNRWLESVDNFVEDMGEWPDGLTLDRIDVNGNYEKANCRWATMTTQIRNRRLFAANSSGATGVYWISTAEVWRVQICIGRKTIYLGTYKKLDDAIKCRELGELKYWS